MSFSTSLWHCDLLSGNFVTLDDGRRALEEIAADAEKSSRNYHIERTLLNARTSLVGTTNDLASIIKELDARGMQTLDEAEKSFESYINYCYLDAVRDMVLRHVKNYDKVYPRQPAIAVVSTAFNEDD